MMIIYKCPTCGATIRKIFQNNPKKTIDCSCGGVCEKQIPDFNSTSYEVIDNGSSVRKAVRREDGQKKGYERGDKLTQTLKDRENLLGKELSDEDEL